MRLIQATEFGIRPQEDITVALAKLCAYLSVTAGEKTVCFEPGTYHIDSSKCQKRMLCITNTAGDNEYAKEETPHLQPVPFFFSGVSDVTFDGNQSIFIIDGKATSVAMEDCRNITLKNMELRYAHPDMHELRVLSKHLFSADFAIDADSGYRVEHGMLCFYGKDYRLPCTRKLLHAGWIACIRKDTPEQVTRLGQKKTAPLPLSFLKVKELGSRTIRAYLGNTSYLKTGDRYCVYDVRRQFAGIFVNRCKNVILQDIKQRFNYSLALVCQDSKDITVNHITFAPEAGSPRALASVADFMQFCMCRGDVVIRNSFFSGAGDDCLNVHGIHFQIVRKKKKELTVRFMHPQTHGFNPLRVGDRIAYINPKTLLEQGTAQIEHSELLNETDIRLVVSSTAGAAVGTAIEDISACPNLTFRNNQVTRIITRGLLLTTRGKVLVEDNQFVSTSLSGILLSDDAKSWYESGRCQDVTIRNNVFEHCGDTPILIQPENKTYAGPVHENIQIMGNTFQTYPSVCIRAKDTDRLLIKDNVFLSDGENGRQVETRNCNKSRLLN